MRPWPRTLFGQVLALQLVFIVLAFIAATLLLTREQARVNAEAMAALWAPALEEALQRGLAPGESARIAVRRELDLIAGEPPRDAWNPEGAPRHEAFERALRERGLPVAGLRVSGPTRDAVLWVDLGAPAAPRWIGIRTGLDGDDLPWRVLGLFGVALLLAVVVAAAIAAMVARPARRIAAAVRSVDSGAEEPALPAGGPAEICVLADSVRATFAARRTLEGQRALMLEGLSHDLRAPLTRIRLAAELLDAEVLDAARERIVADIGVLDRIVGDFVTLVRDESGALDAIEDLREVVDEAARAVGWPQLPALSAAACPVAVRGAMLRRLVDNLLGNALRYGRPPFALEVDRLGVDRARLRVANAVDGPTSDPQRLRRPFERGEPHRGSPGSGLGLAIVDRLAQRMGGQCDVDLADGVWTVVVSLPLVHGETAGPAA